MGHSFTIHTWPSRSMICALISPTFSYIRSFQSFVPAIIASRASLTQPGHSESVCRGQPSVGLLFSHDFSSGLSDHFGVKFGFGLYLLKNWMVSKAAPAVVHRAASNTFQTFAPTPAFPGMSQCLAFLTQNQDQPIWAVLQQPGKNPPSPFYSYSLPLPAFMVQPHRPKGENWGANGTILWSKRSPETTVGFVLSVI